MKEVWIKSFLRNFKILIEEQIQGNSQRENCSWQGSLAIHIIILEMFFDPIILVLGILIYECKSFGKSDYLLNPSTSFHYPSPP